MFRAHFIYRVSEIVRNSIYFKVTDFDIINTSSEVKGALVEAFKVVYRFDEGFYFKVSRSPLTRDELQIECAPGKSARKESAMMKDQEHILSYLGFWLSWIQEELAALPFNRELQQQQEEIKDLLNQFGDLPNEYFSREEGEQLRARLEELEKVINGKLETIQEDDSEEKMKLKVVKNDIHNLKAQSKTLTKKNWLGSFVVRYSEWRRTTGVAGLISASIYSVKALLVDADEIDTEIQLGPQSEVSEDKNK